MKTFCLLIKVRYTNHLVENSVMHKGGGGARASAGASATNLLPSIGRRAALDEFGARPGLDGPAAYCVSQ